MRQHASNRDSRPYLGGEASKASKARTSQGYHIPLNHMNSVLCLHTRSSSRHMAVNLQLLSSAGQTQTGRSCTPAVGNMPQDFCQRVSAACWSSVTGCSCRQGRQSGRRQGQSSTGQASKSSSCRQGHELGRHLRIQRWDAGHS